jgi:hypothetical protein
MVICDTHDFVYLRVPKNASSSLAEYFIRNFCTQQDAWTEVNDCGIPTHNVPIRLIRMYQHQYRFIHLTLSELVSNKIISEETLFRKRIITPIRDPFMRQLSLYFFLKRGQTKSVSEFRYLFKEGRHETDRNNMTLQTDYARVKGVDYAEYWLYNKLDRHVNAFTLQHNIDNPTALQNFKGGFTPKNQELIDEYYDQKTLDAVKKYYEKDIEKIMELETGLQLS